MLRDSSKGASDSGPARPGVQASSARKVGKQRPRATRRSAHSKGPYATAQPPTQDTTDLL